MERILRNLAVASVTLILGLSFTSCKSGSDVTVDQAVSIATDAYIYGYPLVTMDMTRKRLTNVAVPGEADAPMGQMIRLRTYPPVDNHAVTAPNADTLYTMTWLDVSKEPWILGVPDMGNRYFLLPFLDGWTEVFEVPGTRTTGGAAATYAITGPGWSGKLPDGVKVPRDVPLKLTVTPLPAPGPRTIVSLPAVPVTNSACRVASAGSAPTCTVTGRMVTVAEAGVLVSPLTLAVNRTVEVPADTKLCVTVVPLTPLSVWSMMPSPFQSSW